MTDAELWLKAHSGAPSAKLPEGATLTDEQHDWANDMIAYNEKHG